MAAVVMTVDRTAYRRLDRSLHGAESALEAWGALRRRDRAPNGYPEATPIHAAMAKDREWLDPARPVPEPEPLWMPALVALYCRQTPLVQEFWRLRWQHGRTTDQARRRLNMSRWRADELVKRIRETVRDEVLAS